MNWLTNDLCKVCAYSKADHALLEFAKLFGIEKVIPSPCEKFESQEVEKLL